MKGSPIKIGIVGCGDISDIYLQIARRLEVLEVVACADLIGERAEAKAREYNVPKAYTTEDLLTDPEIEIVVNLTVHRAHAPIALAAIEAGKSIYNEKPLAVTREEGRQILEAAAAKGVLVGCAPDTFLGGGLQTCRKLIDDGWIGEPIAATAFTLRHGPEQFHPEPESYYEVGGGPMFTIGPYYLTALTTMLGPVRRVAGSTRRTFPERLVGKGPRLGARIKVDVPTHVAGLMEFESGVAGAIITSFDVWHSELPRIEVHGTEGSLGVPDPNRFGGPVRLRRAHSDRWSDMPLTHRYVENSRGLGIADMAYALRSGRPHRANGELAYHVLDVVHAFHDAARESTHIEVSSTCRRPAPLPMGLPPGTLDD